MSNVVGISPKFFLRYFYKIKCYINSHGYLKLIVCMFNHWVKGLYLGINLVPYLVN